MKKRNRSFYFGLLFLWTAWMLMSSQGLAKEKYVTVLALGDYTGAVAALAAPALLGIEDGFKEINSQGGIKGIKIKFIAIDTRYDVARNISAYKKHRRDHKLIQVIMVCTGAQRALTPIMTRDKVIICPPPDGKSAAHPAWTFLWGPAYQDGFGATLKWVVDDWKTKGKTGKPKVGYMSWDNPYGKAALEGSVEYAKTLPMEFLPLEFFPTGTLNHAVWLNRLAKGGADYIYVGGVDPTPTNVIRDAYKLGLTKKIQFMTDYWGPTQTVGVRQHAKALEGSVTTTFYLKGTEAQQNPLASSLWTKWQKKPVEEMNGIYLVGLGMYKFLEGAMTKAIDKFGYDKLDGEAMYWAYTQITGLERGGIAGPCAYSKTERRGSHDVKIYRVKNRELVPITDWFKAPDCVSMHKWD
ncbi:MAG: ABC transporter substrate-binding protein [Desulfatiglans sp.]|nr:ABC transporter substrate-binding protein [Desulfatiglans sp.]